MGDLFVELASILTGEAVLDPRVLDAHLQHATAKIGGELQALLATFEQIPPDRRRADFDARIWSDHALRLTAEKIAILLFTGGLPIWKSDGSLGGFDYFDRRGGDVHAEGVFGAVMWRVIGAHPPGLSGGYFGYWRYPPEH